MFNGRCLWNRDHVLLADAPVQRNLGFAFGGGLSNSTNNSLRVRCPDISEARCKWTVGNHRDSVLLAILEHPTFNGPLRQAVTNLIGHDSLSGTGRLGVHQVAHGEIADSDEPDFASIYKFLHPPHRLFDGNCEVGPVKLVTIDMIGVHLPEASFCRSNQVAPPEIPRKHLSCENHLMPPALDRFADELFGSVRLCSVYQASPTFDSRAKRLDTSTVVPCAESDFGQTNTAVDQFSQKHRRIFTFSPRMCCERREESPCRRFNRRSHARG